MTHPLKPGNMIWVKLNISISTYSECSGYRTGDRMAIQSTGNLVKSMALLEQAREDVYFSQLDRELIEALHRKAEISTERIEAGSGPGLIAYLDMSDLQKNN